MIGSMTDPAIETEEVDHGGLLVAFLEKEWASLGTRRSTWCRSVGIADSTVARWKEGTAPQMENLKAVAEGLGLPLLQILVEAGYIEKSPRTVHSRPVLDAVQALRHGTGINEVERATLLAVLHGMRQVTSGEVGRSDFHRPATSRRARRH